MSYSDGWAAINLEMPARIPHTETALDTHSELIREVTGIVVKPHSPAEVSTQASFMLMKAINLDFRRNTLLHHQPFGDLRTRMINGQPAGSSRERRVNIESPFGSEEDLRRFNFDQAFGVPDRTTWKAKFEADYKRCAEETPDLVNTTGIASTLISGLLDILGWHLM